MATQQLHILLADDDRDDCNHFEQVLAELPLASHLTIVQDGEELMKVLTKETNEPPHALFLDLNMPRKNGYECLIEIKRNEKLKAIPVIIFTSSDKEDDVNEVYKNKAQYYIRKPVNLSQLKKVIHEALTFTRQGNISPTRENFMLPNDKRNK